MPITSVGIEPCKSRLSATLGTVCSLDSALSEVNWSNLCMNYVVVRVMCKSYPSIPSKPSNPDEVEAIPSDCCCITS